MVPGSARSALSSDAINQVQLEDIVLCESVQRGLASGFFDRGRLMLAREHAIQHFQRLVYRSQAER